MRNIFILIAFLFVAETLKSQQIPPLSLYGLNHYAINPAATGTGDMVPLAFSYRKSWAGIGSAPALMYLSGDIELMPTMGAGAKIFNYQTGPSRKSGLELSYSYHLIFDRHTKLSFGLSAMFYQFYLDKSNLTREEENDEAFEGAEQKITPDASFGTYFYGKNYFAGLSMPHLFSLDKNHTLKESQVRYYYLHGGYTFEFAEDFTVEPSVLLKFLEAGIVQVDVNARVEYLEQFSLGVSYRSSDAVSFQLGYKYQTLQFGYAYDFTFSDLKASTFGSHEILLIYSLPNFLNK